MFGEKTLYGYLIITEEEQSTVVHQLPGLSMFCLRHVPEGGQEKQHYTYCNTICLICMICLSDYFFPLLCKLKAKVEYLYDVTILQL